MELFEIILVVNVSISLVLLGLVGTMFYKLHQKRLEENELEDPRIVKEYEAGKSY